MINGPATDFLSSIHVIVGYILALCLLYSLIPRPSQGTPNNSEPCTHTHSVMLYTANPSHCVTSCVTHNPLGEVVTCDQWPSHSFLVQYTCDSGVHPCHLPTIIIIIVSYPDPTLKRGKGLVTVERFLGCAESAVLLLSKPIKSPNVKLARDYKKNRSFVLRVVIQYSQGCWFSTTKKLLNCHLTLYLSCGRGLGTRLFAYQPTLLQPFPVHVPQSSPCMSSSKYVVFPSWQHRGLLSSPRNDEEA